MNARYDNPVKVTLATTRTALDSLHLNSDDLEVEKKQIVSSLDPWQLLRGLTTGTLDSDWFKEHRIHELSFENGKHTFYFYAGKNFPAFIWFDTYRNKAIKRAIP